MNHGGDRRTWRFEIHPMLERDAAAAKRAIPPFLRKRRLEIGTKVFIAYEADSLLEIVSDTTKSRPGHPLG